MPKKYGFLRQDVSNTIAHGMSSSEEAKYLMWDVDPELLVPPEEMVRQAAAARQQERERAESHDRELGYVAVSPMVLE